MNTDLQTFLQAWTGGGDLSDAESERMLLLFEYDAAFRAQCVEEIRMLGLIKAVQTPSPRWLVLHDALGISLAASAETAADDLASRVNYLVQNQSRKNASFRWFGWRPLTAAAAGIVFGMLCTSVVFGFVNQRAAVNKVSLLAFDAGLEDATQTLKDGLSDSVGQWGMDDASVVAAEGHVLPLQGECMMRLEPIPLQKPVKNRTSRAYQMLDLRSQPVATMNGEAEAEVTASFCAKNSDLSSRYLIRAIALDEAPETATKNFWSKVESDGVVSESQRFDTLPGKSGWHTFSMKLRLPPGSKTLVLIFGAVPPEDTSRPALIHYLDDVQVSLLTPQPLP